MAVTKAEAEEEEAAVVVVKAVKKTNSSANVHDSFHPAAWLRVV